MIIEDVWDVDFTEVEYEGTGPAMEDLVGKQVDFMCDQTTNTTPQITAGTVKAYNTAIAEGAPRLHGFAERNICARAELVKGDVDKGFAEADEIFEDTFEFPMIFHYSMEPHTAIAQVDGDGIQIWTSTGHPFGVRQEIAEIFHAPLSRVRVHVNFVGGAYGSKSGAKIEPLVVALARKAQRPVRVTQSVSEAMATVRRHSAVCTLKTGVKKDGALVAKQAEVYLNTGAYAETGPIVTGRTLTRILGPYRVPNIKVNSYCVYTNTVSAASFRSIGGPQTAWATESQMDIIAQKLGLDPVERAQALTERIVDRLEPTAQHRGEHGIERREVVHVVDSGESIGDHGQPLQPAADPRRPGVERVQPDDVLAPGERRSESRPPEEVFRRRDVDQPRVVAGRHRVHTLDLEAGEDVRMAIDQLVGDATRHIAALQGELRLAHLKYHLETLALLTRGDTVGVFQLENTGMRELVRRLQPDSFDDVMRLAYERFASERGFSPEDFRKLAKRRLSRAVFDYIDGGAGDERGLVRNREALHCILFSPKVLVDVSERDVSVPFLEGRLPIPFVIGPTGLNGAARPGGDAMLARAAAKAGIPFVLSTAATSSIEEIARTCDGEWWFQLYVMERDFATELCRRALAAGCRTLVLTVDCQIGGRRERDTRNGFVVPFRMSPRFFADCAAHPAWALSQLRHGPPKFGNIAIESAGDAGSQAVLMQRKLDTSFDWEDLERLRQDWPHRLIVKGIMRADDAHRCFAMGIDGVVISNHGRRQLEDMAAPIDIVPEVEVLEEPVAEAQAEKPKRARRTRKAPDADAVVTRSVARPSHRSSTPRVMSCATAMSAPPRMPPWLLPS